VGTSAVLGDGERPQIGVSESCIATERTTEPVAVSSLEDDLSHPTSSAVGTWLVGECPPPNDDDPRVCIPGGATILGSRENTDYIPSNYALDCAPPRVFGLSPFLIDRDELSVKELLALVDGGYAGALPQINDGDLKQPTPGALFGGCTLSFNTKGRDDYPVTCVGYRAAREICQYKGGDLPTEAQWEHVATVVGHPSKARYPWGNDLPTCNRAVYGRIPLDTNEPECALGDGPRPFSEGTGDVSPIGIRRLFGSVSEWVLDDAAAYTSAEWNDASVVDPHVTNNRGRKVNRGSNWMNGPLRPAFRQAPPGDEGLQPLGVRCAYPVASP
jgi:formylglycine-generating enzyme required for sulfatase activity